MPHQRGMPLAVRSSLLSRRFASSPTTGAQGSSSLAFPLMSGLR
jgi:hypothetical protein